VSYEGKNDRGTRYALQQRVEPATSGARIELIVEIEPPPGVDAGRELQRALDADVDRMTVRIYVLLDRSRGPQARPARDDFLPRGATNGLS
jgi:hypothetical protein